MRKSIVTLLSAALLVLVALPVFAQYPPGSNITPSNSINCVITVPATLTADGQMTCTAGGLLPGTQFTFSATFPRLQAAGNFSQSDLGDSGAAAVAFVGAQADGISVSVTGTVDAQGVASGAAAVPAGADTSQPIAVTLFGTSGDGSIVSVSTTVNAAAAQADPDTTPATGAESGLLALIALALVGAGGGAVMMARRKSRLEA